MPGSLETYYLKFLSLKYNTELQITFPKIKCVALQMYQLFLFQVSGATALQKPAQIPHLLKPTEEGIQDKHNSLLYLIYQAQRLHNVEFLFHSEKKETYIYKHTHNSVG